MTTSTVGAVNVQVNAHTHKFDKGMKRASASVSRFGKTTKMAQGAVKGLLIGMGGLTTMGGVSTMLGAGGITYGMVRFAGSVETLNRAMHSSLAIMGDVSSTMKVQMMDTVMDTAAATKFAASDIAKSYFFLASAGLDVTQSIAALPAAIKFAQAGMFDAKRAVDLLTDAQSALGLSADDAAENLENMVKVSDALVKANTLANASVEQFSTALTTKAGAALRIVNKEMNEGLAVLAVFADQGIKGAEAGTALSIVMRDLQTKAVKNVAAFKNMNVAVFNSLGQMRNLSDIIRDLENAMGGLSAFGQKKMILDMGFSDKSVNFLLQLIGRSGDIAQFERKLDDAKGITDEVAGKQMTEWMTAWAKISADLMKFGDAHILPFVNALAKAGAEGNLAVLLQETATLAARTQAVFEGRGLMTTADIKLASLGGTSRRDIFEQRILRGMGTEGGAFTGKSREEQNVMIRKFFDDNPEEAARADAAKAARAYWVEQEAYAQSLLDFAEGRAEHPIVTAERKRLAAQKKADDQKAEKGAAITAGDKALDVALRSLADIGNTVGINTNALFRGVRIGDDREKFGPIDFTKTPKGIKIAELNQQRRTDADKKARKDSDRRRASAVKEFEKSMNPFERLNVALHDLGELRGGIGGINDDTYNRRKKMLTDSFNDSFKKGKKANISFGGAEEGSEQALQNMQRYIAGSRSVEQIAKEGLKAQQATARNTGDLVKRRDELTKTETVEIGN